MLKSVIIYTYFSSPSSDYNLEFFVKQELSYKNNIDYIIVINGNVYNTNIHFPILDNLTILKRENIGFDFGGWSDALLTNNLYENYDKFIFVNLG